MSTEAQFIFEDGQVGQRNETGAELMEVDQYDPQTKALTTLGQYSQYQVDHQQASDEINEESNTQVSAGGLSIRKTRTLFSKLNQEDILKSWILSIKTF